MAREPKAHSQCRATIRLRMRINGSVRPLRAQMRMIYSFVPRDVHPPDAPPMSSKATLFLIDGSSQMYRAYHAIRGLSGPDGKSTNAIYGFTTMLRKLLTDHQPTYIAASFDLAGPTFRDDIVTDYKANRAPMPGDLAEQIPWVHE